MNQTLSRIRKLLITVLCVFLLMGGTLVPSSSASAESLLPSGEYEILEPVPSISPDYDYSPYAGGRDFPQTVLWGDTHLHTSYSFDAGAGGTTLTPAEAYRFARGEEVTNNAGQQVRLSRPLDFLVVSDHSDQLGSFQQFVSNPPQDCGEDQAQVDQWHEDILEGGDAAADATVDIIEAFSQGTVPECMLQSKMDFAKAWNDEVKWAEEYNDPYQFTAFIGYEWTSLASGNNLHRNVIYRDNGIRARRLLPKTTEDGTNPELLWEWMKNYEDLTKGKVLAIPHNGNLSNGLMFADNKFADNTNPDGDRLDPDYAKQRQMWEPLYEVIQIKGGGETHPYLSDTDEFADFEVKGWDNGNLDLTAPKDPSMYEHEYARAALENGLKFQEEFQEEFGDNQANPFKFGMIGSTDAHVGLSGGEENNFLGKVAINEPSPERAMHLSKESSFEDENEEPVQRFGWQYAAAGYAGVWARENTRESIFDAMKRREVYASSGPRMIVRFFGGWDFSPDDVGRNPGDVGYEKGVPMGSDLPPVATDLSANPTIPSPTFLVAALKDPIRGNLDRIQIVKGWLDANSGEPQEEVYDVVWSDADVRQVTDGKVPPVGSVVNPDITDAATDPGTVNTETAEWTNTIGAVELATVWTDPDFDPDEQAFYYARVLEIPTPRWTDYDKVFFGEDEVNLAPEVPLTLQERAYTSPIWYNPDLVTVEPLPVENVSDSDFWNRIIQEVEKHYSTK